MPLVGYKRILSYGEDGDGTRSEYVPVFPRNPRGGAAKPLAKEDIRQLEEWMDTHGFGEILCHGAYTMNGASTKEEVREFARTAIREDLAKVSLLPRCLYNFHPGAHLKQGTAVAIPLIADMVNYAMDQEGLNTTVLLKRWRERGRKWAVRLRSWRK